MGPPVKVYGTGECRLLDVREFLHRGGACVLTLSIRDVGDVSMHQEYARRFSPPGDTMNDYSAPKTVSGWELVIPTIDDGSGGGKLGGGGDIFHLPPEHSHTFHHDQNNYGYVSCGGVTPWGAGVPAVVVTRELGPVGDAGSGKCGGNIGYGGRWIQAIRLRRRDY